MTSYTTKNIPDGMWVHWKRMVPRDKTLGSRNVRLLAADVACRREHGHGLIEYALYNDILDEQDISNALDLEHPNGEQV